MAKYSQEFKLKVVEHYLSGHGDSVTGFSIVRSLVRTILPHHPGVRT